MTKDRQNKLSCQAQTGELLLDKRKNGRKRDWAKYKLQSLAVANAYSTIDYLEKYAHLIADCGSWLRFKVCPKGHHKRLAQASFCKCRLCVMCQWRKSLVMFHQVLQLTHAHREQYKSDIPLLLTLTVPNVPALELNNCLDMMQYAFKKLVNRNPFKRAVRSWFRGLEVTYNEDRTDYHPHYHVLLLVPENYFRKERGLYITQEQWLTMWRESTGIESITQVDIRRVRKRSQKGELEAVSAEVAKYATKPSSYISRMPSGDYKASSEVVEALHNSMRGRRLVAFGGLFSKLRKALKLEDIEKADLTNITEDEKSCLCPICQSTLQEELYSWRLGLRGYVG